jgi:hypothetical protein
MDLRSSVIVSSVSAAARIAADPSFTLDARAQGGGLMPDADVDARSALPRRVVVAGGHRDA